MKGAGQIIKIFVPPLGNIVPPTLKTPAIDTYCFINYDFKYVYTMKAVLIKAFILKSFLVKGKREILKYFLLYDETTNKKWET